MVIEITTMSTTQTEMMPKSFFLLPMMTLWQREVLRFLRQRSRVIGALGTPIVFWVLIGSGLGRSFNTAATSSTATTVTSAGDAAQSSMNYLEYFFPGTMVLIVLFTAIFSMISIIDDRKEGFMQSVIASPTRRSAIVMGKVMGSTTLALMQAMMFLMLAPLSGVPLTLVSGFTVFMVLIPVAVGLSGLGFLIAWGMDSTQGFHALMNLFLVPMWLLSGALFPAAGASSWLGWVMKLNPLTYGVSAVRNAMYSAQTEGGGATLSMSTSIWITILFAVLMIVLSARAVTQKS